MNHKQLIEALAEKTGTTKVAAKAAIDGLIEVITQELEDGGEVSIYGLGKFEVGFRKSRTGRNPQTGEEITIKAAKAPKFKAAKQLKDAIN